MGRVKGRFPMIHPLKQTVSMAAATLLVATGALAQELLFDADFKDAAQAAQQWDGLAQAFKRGDAALRDGGLEIKAAGAQEKGISLKPKVSPGLPFSVEFKASVLNRTGKDNHFYLDFDGALVVIRQWGLELKGDKAKAPCHYGGIGNNQEQSFLIEAGRDVVKVYCGNTLLQAFERKRPAATASLSLCVTNSDVLFKGFKVYSGLRSKQTISSNVLRNSSFETVTNNLPDYWGTPHWGMRSPLWIANMDQFRKQWGIDRTAAFDGRNSFRIQVDGDDPNQYWTLGLFSCWTDMRMGSDYVFSVYMKSDRDGMPVRFGRRTEKMDLLADAKVGKEWKRYSVKFKCQSPLQEQMVILPGGKGTLWIDAAQAEEGATSTAYARHGSERERADARKEAVQTQVPVVAGTAPAIDGVINEQEWGNAVRCSLVKANDGGAPDDPTAVRLLRDDRNLYVAFECFDAQMDKLVANVKTDKGPVWNDDDVELFFKPDAKGNSYYQFAVNSLSVKYEGRTLADSAWRGAWTCAVKRGAKSWTAEIAVPFSTLAMESGKESFGFNACRNNPKTAEATAWSPTFGSFLEFKKWGRLVMGGQVGGVFACDLRLEKAFPAAGLHAFHATLVNNTDADITGTLCLSLQAGKQEVSKSQPVLLKARSRTAAEFAGLRLPDNCPCVATLTCTSGKGTLLSKVEEFTSTPVLEIKPEFSYFSDEKALRFKIVVNGAQKPDGLAVHYAFYKDAARLDEQTRALPAGAGQLELALPNQSGVGQYRLEVTLRDAAQARLGDAAQAFSVLRHEDYEGKVNLWRHSIQFAGKETFLWSNIWEGLPSEESIKLMAGNGFNCVLIMIHSGSLTPEEIKNLLAAGQKHKVNFILWLGVGKEGIDRLIQAAPLLRNQASLLAFWGLDEVLTQGWSDAAIDDAARRLRQAIGGNALLFHNENDYGVMQRANFRNDDIISVDHYTIPDRELASVSLVVGNLRKQAGDKPACFVTQSAGNAYCYGREPTPLEQENQVYQAFACDVWNIISFDNVPLGAENFPTLKRLRAEWDQLLALDIPAAPAVPAFCSNPDIKFLAKKTAKGQVIVSVNNGDAAPARFSAPWLPKAGVVEVLFENRTLPVKGGAFADSYGRLQRHVYVLAEQPARDQEISK